MLAAAEAFNNTEHDLCRSMAIRGLDRLTADAFIADCRPLLDHNSPAGAVTLNLLENLRSLDAQEIDAVVEPVPGEYQAAIRALWSGLKATGAQPIGDAWETVLRAWWTDNGKALIESRLRLYDPAI
jgi:hypothetical protein